MTQTGEDFDAALAEAVARGYAEADPSADVEGTDAASKAVILSALAFHRWLPPRSVYREGVTAVTAQDVADARLHGSVVKLVAVLERTAGDDLMVRVHPAMVPLGHPLADVRGADNAVVVEAAGAGRLLFHGAGAGGAPTASAVLGDLVTAARRRLLGHHEAVAPRSAPAAVRAMGELRSRYHLRVGVADTGAALDDVAGVLRRHDVGVASVQRRRTAGAESLTLLTETTRESALLAAVETVAALPSVAGIPRFLRVLDSAA